MKCYLIEVEGGAALVPRHGATTPPLPVSERKVSERVPKRASSLGANLGAEPPQERIDPLDHLPTPSLVSAAVPVTAAPGIRARPPSRIPDPQRMLPATLSDPTCLRSTRYPRLRPFVLVPAPSKRFSWNNPSQRAALANSRV